MNNHLTNKLTLRLDDDNFNFIVRMAELSQTTPSKYIRMCIDAQRIAVAEYEQRNNTN